MKVGIFTDSHYCDKEVLCGTRFPSLSLKKVKEIMNVFKSEGVELCLCLGDLIDKADDFASSKKFLTEITAAIKESGIPFYVIQGNHDCADFSAEEFSQMTGSPAAPFVIETDTRKFIFLDANFRSDYRSFYEEGVEWTDSNLPPEQVAFLQAELASAEKPCAVVIHENLDPNVDGEHIVKNAEEVRRVIEESGKADLVLQGHFHKGADNTVNGIKYITVPAVCEGKDNRYLIMNI